MEAVGILASAAQISVYLFNIISTLQGAGAQIRNAPTQLQDKVEQLLFLKAIIDTIKATERLHTNLIADYLVTIQDKISHLRSILTKSLYNIKGASCGKIWLLFTVIKAEKQIKESFTALEQDRSNLHFYVTSVCGTILLIGQGTSSQRDNTEGMSGALIEVFKSGKKRKAAEAESQRQSYMVAQTLRNKEFAMSSIDNHQSSQQRDEGLQAENRLIQTFKDLNSNDTGSSNKLGNHGFEAVHVTAIEQRFEKVVVENGGSNEADNTISNSGGGRKTNKGTGCNMP